MTKERKLAIEMWEFVVEHFNEADVYTLKQRFANEHPEIYWQNECWFCEYCRRDYRPFHPGREDINHRANKCHNCPLYKYEIEHGNYTIADDACGCDYNAWHSYPLFSKVQHDQNKKAAETILKLLKGEEV